MVNPISLSQNIIKDIESIISQARGFSRTIQHEFMQQELYKLFRENGFDSFFEFGIEYYHIYRGKKKAGKVTFKNGRLDIYAKKDDIGIAIEFDSGATLRWKSIEKLLQCEAQYCFGIVGGVKTDEKIKLDMYDEKNLWKWKLSIEDHINLFDKKKEFDKIYNLLNKKLWFGNIKTVKLISINHKELLSSSISLHNLKHDSHLILQSQNDNENTERMLKESMQQKIVNIDEDMRNIMVTGRVDRIFGHTTFERDDGSEGRVGWFRIYDETGHIKVVVWDDHTYILDDFDFEMYSPVKISNGYVKEGRDGELELHIGKYGNITFMNESECNIPLPVKEPKIRTSKSNLEQLLKNLDIHETVYKKKICPHCSFQNLISVNYCKKCGEPLG